MWKILLCLLVISGQAVYSQTGSVTLSGTVNDLSDNLPLPYANVVLRPKRP